MVKTGTGWIQPDEIRTCTILRRYEQDGDSLILAEPGNDLRFGIVYVVHMDTLSILNFNNPKEASFYFEYLKGSWIQKESG